MTDLQTSPSSIRANIARETFPEKYYSDEVRSKCETAMAQFSKMTELSLSKTRQELSETKQALFVQRETLQNLYDQNEEIFDLLDKCHTELLQNKDTRDSLIVKKVNLFIKKRNRQ